MAGLNRDVAIVAIVVLGPGALDTARRIQSAYSGAKVHGLARRVVEADVAFTELGAHLRALYAAGTPIVALCSAGIVIRAIAPCLANKGAEPPVLAVAEDGSAVVPLVGGLSGVNVMAREIARALDTAPAITTSGELRFGTCLLNPPEGYVLADIEHGKRFVSDLLAGAPMRIEGAAPWLDDAGLPRAPDARLAIRVTSRIARPGEGDDLMIHPRCVVAWVGEASRGDIAERVRLALREHGIAPLSLAVLLAPLRDAASEPLAEAARTLGVPLRFNAEPPTDASERFVSQDIVLAVSARPVDPSTTGRARGKLTVIGLGPGSADLMVPAAKQALAQADDILGYDTYVRMAGPFRDDQRVHGSDNREEMQRARHAFELASEGRRVVVVSSGDPGVFAMAAAVLEALDQAHAREPAWTSVELEIVPGVSAALTTAARAGAPLGHDFCMLSLSDNLKPWSIIETRLRHAAEADLVMAFYNPVSRARPWQLDRALDIVRAYRAGATKVVLGRDVGRPGETLVTTTLDALRSDQVDMRTMVIVGSSTTRGFPKDAKSEWVYTPRWYCEKP
ncbi:MULTISPECIES: precorrin-3B C(17)-methyltransferase [unclassified Caballeronia]|uniref:precorrin-3B C(17)-methyltransferase n=1 Tax=unclassified Caballeronia TaxID=2646786 RepID=UPI0028671B44|nr:MULTISPECIES: precorrin-3B C(17)-methyltransferase [unclassified Caballeronia]MDR5754083.1 precorrin-3B C(17)-methyltransferase [Caballeronia sp. LZ024]MDR5840462.1 precorrin-3B C(17)-methyltransferase [Caballeronia sp. LZ031]